MTAEQLDQQIEQVADQNAQEPSAPVEDANKQQEASTEEGADKSADEPKDETPEQKKDRLAKQQEHFERREARHKKALQTQQRQLQEAKTRIAELEKLSAKADPLADKPTADNFDDIEDYAEALAEWKANQKEKAKAQGEGQKQTEQERIQQAIEFEKKKLNFESKQEAFRAKEPTYDKNAEVVNKVITLVNPQDPSFQAFAATVLNADDSPALINFLGQNPQEMLNLFGKTPFEVEDRLTEIIESLANKPAPQAQPKADLPEPPKGLSGSSSIKKDPMKMSKDELRDWLKAK